MRKLLSQHPSWRQLFFGILLAIVTLSGSANQRPAVGPFILTNMSGNQISLEQMQGKVVLVNFWASWCAPCIRELPSMQQLKIAMWGRPFEILAINVGEDHSQISNFLDYYDAPLDFQILINDNMSVASQWKVQAMPTSILLDKQGNRVETITGARDWAGDDVVAMIQPLLDE